MIEGGAALAAFVSTLLLMYPLIKLLHLHSIVDVPNARSSHGVSTPRGGGIAVMAGVTAGVLVGTHAPVLWALIALAVAGAVVGWADDLRDLPAIWRLVAQVLLAIAVVATVQDLGSPTALLVAIIAVVGVVGYVNAFNFMDGINGISGLSGAVAGAWFCQVGSAESDPVLAAGGAALAGACIGFLPWNLPRARVFLGDVGSYGLGILIAGLAVRALAEGVSLAVVLAPLVIYLTDTAWTLARRIRRGESWREAHREHTYQQLGDAGLGHAQATGVVAAHNIVVCAAIYFLPVAGAVAAVLAIMLAYLSLPALLNRRRLAGVS